MKKIIFIFYLAFNPLFSSNTASWINGGSSGWGIAGNWSTGIVPNAIDDVAILANGPPAPVFPVTVTLPFGGVTIGTVQIDDVVPYTIQGGATDPITFDVSSGSAAITVTDLNGDAPHTMQAFVNLVQPIVITQGSTFPFTMNFSISETGASQSLTKDGSGTLQLFASNSYSGGTVINDGTVEIVADDGLGAPTGSLTIGNGTLQCDSDILPPSIRSGSFTGSGTINTEGNTVSLSGSFNGSGGITMEGIGGLLIFSGINSYLGPTILNNGTLQANTSALPSDATVNAGTTLIFSQDFNGTYSKALSGSGSITKTGLGVLQITGNSPSFSGTFTVTQGGLKVNGTISQANVTIGSGTILSGVGTVGPTTVNGNGTIAPGNSIGAMTVNGPLVLAANALYPVEINALHQATQLIVNGPATLTGAILQVTPDPGFYGFNTSYTVLTSTTLGGTTFGSYSSTNPNVVPILSYLPLSAPTDVVLSIVIADPFVGFPFSSQNTQNVANNLVELFGIGALNPDLLNAVDLFTGQSLSAIDRALSQMDPAIYSAWAELQMETGAQLISLFHRNFFNSDLFSCNCSCPTQSRFWIKPLVNFLQIGTRDEEKLGFNGGAGGIAFGWDRELLDGFSFGFGGAWNQNDLHWKEHRGHGRANGFYGSLYSDYYADRFYLGAAMLAGIDFYDTDRNISFFGLSKSAKADFHATDLMAQLQAACFFRPSAITLISPFAHFDFFYLDSGQLHEKGASGFNLELKSHSASTLRTELGLTFQGQKNKGKYLCTSPSLSLGWVNILPLQRDPLQATFAGSSIPFTAHGWNQTWNLFSLDAGFQLGYREFAVSFDYHLETSLFSSPSLLDQNGSASLNWKW